jgi:hypothetical protein
MSPLFHAVLAGLEAESGEWDETAGRLDRALADSARRENRTFDAELHRVRGEILLKRDAANTAPAEEAFLTAIATAQTQKARSFELRAALALASFMKPPAAPPTPMPCSRRRSMASRRRQNFLKSPRRKILFAFRFAQIPAIQRRLGEGVKSTRCGP